MAYPAAALTRPAAAAIAVEPSRRHVWPWFALGGAVRGAGTVVAMAATGCDAGCRDDGSWAIVPFYAAAAALSGAVVGVLVDTLAQSDQRT